MTTGLNAKSGDIRERGTTGDDVFDIASTADTRVSVRSGAGNDTITIGLSERIDVRSGSGDDVITLNGADRADVRDGAGADTITLNGDYGRARVQLSGNDNLGAVSEVDTITLGDDASFGRALVVQNFAAGEGGDVLDLSGYLAANTTWDGSSDAFAGGFLQLVQAGDDVLLQVDADGGADGFETLVKFGDVLAEDITGANLGLVI